MRSSQEWTSGIACFTMAHYRDHYIMTLILLALNQAVLAANFRLLQWVSTDKF